jgi:hypothetical protein
MPRAALLSIHARVRSTSPTMLDHASLVQLWGPRFSNYVVAAKDLAIFSLGRLPEHPRRRARAVDTAERLHAALKGRKIPFGEAGREMGVIHNSLRYAAATGRVLIRWDGARQPLVWTVSAPEMDPQDARLELARRYLHVFGPTTGESFADWAGVQASEAMVSFESLRRELTSVRTPLGDAWILTADATAFRSKTMITAPARLLPSGDTFFLLWGNDRKLLVPETKFRASLWTSRVWPGALLVNGEIAGVWRRATADVSIATWRKLSAEERNAVEAEAALLPLPGLTGPIGVIWS